MSCIHLEMDSEIQGKGKYHPREKGYELIVDGTQIKGGYRFV